MKTRAIFPAALAMLGAFAAATCRAEQVRMIEGFDTDIFDNSAVADAEGVEIVNGRVVLTGAAAKRPEKSAQPDPAGDQVLELTDGSQLHGKLAAFGKNEITWQRADTAAPIAFNPQEVRRIIFGGNEPAPVQKANATVKLTGGDWLTGDLSAMQGGKFRLAIEGAGTFEIERSRIEWLHLSKAAPPDAYEGPTGPMGLAGWEMPGAAGAGAWDYADGALIARAAMPLTRRFEALADRTEIEFSASDGGNAMRGLTFLIQPGLQSGGYPRGTLYLRFQANNINGNTYDGNERKDFSAVLPADKNPPKETRYRILQDKRAGKLVIFVNGRKVADWNTPAQKEPAQGGSLTWQPTYWSPNMGWTISKIRVRPWDGTIEPDLKADEAGKDVLSSGGYDLSAAAFVTKRQAGSLETITADSVRFSGKDFPRNVPLFIRLSDAGAGDPPAGAAARVWLSQRGEFDVAALGFRDGQLRMRTAFGGEIALPITAVRTIEFPHRIAASDKALSEGGDTLVFRNGDELHGTLLSASHDLKVKWKPVKGTQPVEFTVGRLAGILLANRAKSAVVAPTTAVRFRNGDWLPGELILLDKRQLHLKSPVADHLQIERAGIRAIYFGQNSEVPVWDGASDRQSWMKATSPDSFNGRNSVKETTLKRNPWRYLDGAFSIARNTLGNGYGNGPNIGRSFDTLPEKVEVSFDLSTPKGPSSYSIQLFNDEKRPGLMIQGSWDSAYIYDMSPRKQGGVVFNQPQQIEFGEKIGGEGNRRAFRFLADRRTGRIVMIVNDIPVGGFGNKAGKESPKAGKGIAIIPQPMGSSVTVSNLWIGPWSGDAPEVPRNAGRANRRNGIIINGGVLNLNGLNQGAVIVNGKAIAPADKKGDAPEKPATTDERKDKPAEKPAVPADRLTLVNGDETSGTLESASATEIHLQCDVGKIDIPVSRALVAEFPGGLQPPAAGIRLHLAGKGSVTVDSLQVADGLVTCHSAAVGDLTFNASALAEIVFQPRNTAPPAGAADKKTGQNPGTLNGGIIINGGGGVLRLNGKVIIN